MNTMHDLEHQLLRGLDGVLAYVAGVGLMHVRSWCARIR
jgi:hypothetical protein